MKKRKLLLIVLLLLLISVGIVMAQSSTNFILQRSAMFSGGVANSANYTVTAVIGQPATDIVVSANHNMSAGFLQPDSGFEVYLPMITR